MMKNLLLETYRTTKKVAGVDPSKPGNLKAVLVDDAAFSTYVEGLAESLENPQDKETFKILAENTRLSLLENSMFQINPYEVLTLPILRVFYPKFVAKEAVTVSPMDKPESVKAFIRAEFTRHGASSSVKAPAVNTDVSVGGSTSGTPLTGTFTFATDDTLDVLGAASLTKDQAHLNRTFTITSVTDGTDTVTVNEEVAVEGHFSFSVTFPTSGLTDVISGKVDFLNGTVSASQALSTGGATAFDYSTTISLEENKVNSKVTLVVDKIRLYAKDRQISAEWSINIEQDMRALFDVSMQAEIVNILGQQIALDIDREIVNALINANSTLNGASHKATFDRTPPAGYTWGVKYWHENILPELNKLSAQVYTDTNIDAANTILANPLDVSILEDLQGFNYTGTSSLNGDLGYRSATVAGGKWKVLTSAVVPQGTMVLVYKPVEELKCVYLYCPYVPAVLHPYPIGAKPSLTILSRYASNTVRPAGIAALTITES